MTFLMLTLVLGSTALHAGWNLLAHSQRSSPFLFARMCAWIGVIGCVPLGAGIWFNELLPAELWLYLLGSGCCLAIYFLSLTQGYRSGDFTIVYPIARALPILMLVGFDLFRGLALTAQGWAGIAIVSLGCLMLTFSGNGTAGRVHMRTVVWILLIALGTAGYTSVDKLAMERIADGSLLLIAQYGGLQFAFALPVLWLVLRGMHGPATAHPAAHRAALAIAAANLCSYLLILWVYQLVDQASYVIAMRQLSIVIGTVIAAFVFKEPAPRTRIAAAAMIGAGVAVIVTTAAT